MFIEAPALNANQTGAEHIVVPGTDHAAQNAGELVNSLLDQFWSSADGGNWARPA